MPSLSVFAPCLPPCDRAGCVVPPFLTRAVLPFYRVTPKDPIEALEQVLVRGTGELLNSLRERQEQTGMVRPGLPVPTEEPSAETGASVFLTSAMGPATDGAVTEAGRTSGGASHDLGPRAGLQVNMTRLANQVAAKVKPKECVAVFEASESALADPDVRPSRPKAIQGTLTYPLPDEATIRAREEKLRSDSATKIQTLLRCRLAQFDMDALRTRHAAAETIVRDMQRLFRGARGRSFVDRKLRLKRAEELRLRLNRQREEKAVDSLKAFFRTFVSAARQVGNNKPAAMPRMETRMCSWSGLSRCAALVAAPTACLPPPPSPDTRYRCFG